jgi:hypothetical protein
VAAKSRENAVAKKDMNLTHKRMRKIKGDNRMYVVKKG